jgi:hypothetical protein
VRAYCLGRSGEYRFSILSNRRSATEFSRYLGCQNKATKIEKSKDGSSGQGFVSDRLSKGQKKRQLKCAVPATTIIVKFKIGGFLYVAYRTLNRFSDIAGRGKDNRAPSLLKPQQPSSAGLKEA